MSVRESGSACVAVGVNSTEQEVPGVNRWSWTERMSKAVYGTLGFVAAYHLLDMGLANFLALDTLKHGTSLLSYLNISLRGADPSMGGKNEAIYRPESGKIHPCENKFFVMENSTVGCVQKTAVGWTKKFSLWANINLVGGVMQDGCKQTSFAAEALTFLTPVLRFKFRPEEVRSSRFEKDPLLPIALFTRQPIHPKHLGICGSLTQGIGLSMFQRMAKDPGKVIWGAACLAAGAFIAKRTYDYVRKDFTHQADESPPSRLRSYYHKWIPSPCRSAIGAIGTFYGLILRVDLTRKLATI